MAIGTSLRYYRQQFNPEAAYRQPQGGQAGIMSMYDPEGMDRFVQAVGKRQERFDTAKMAEAAEIARIGETETYDIKELTNRVKSFEDSVNSLVKDKYNGDYSAAANEIAKMIGTERTNPFYHFNKQKVEMGKSYLDAKMKLGANFIEAGSPFDVSFKAWQNGQTFDFTPLDARDITQRSAAAFQNFAKKVMSDSGLQMSPEGQYFRNTVQTGFRSEDEALAFAEKSGLLDEIYSSMPELANASNQEAVLNAIKQGAVAGIGTTETKYLANQGYLNSLEEARAIKLAGGMGSNKMVESGFTRTTPLVDNVAFDPANSAQVSQIVAKQAEQEGLNLSSINDIASKYKSLLQDKSKVPFTLESPEWGQSAKTILKGWGIDKDSPDYDESLKLVNVIKDVRDRVSKDFVKGKTTASPILQLNEFYGTDTQSINEIQKNKDQINFFVSGLQPTDLMGVNDSDQDKLNTVDRHNLEVLSIAPIPTKNTNAPYIYQLQVRGVPLKTKSGTKAQPVDFTVQMTPGTFADQMHFASGLGKLSGTWAQTFVEHMYEIDPDRAAQMGLPKPPPKVIK